MRRNLCLPYVPPGNNDHNLANSPRCLASVDCIVRMFGERNEPRSFVCGLFQFLFFEEVDEHT